MQWEKYWLWKNDGIGNDGNMIAQWERNSTLIDSLQMNFSCCCLINKSLSLSQQFLLNANGIEQITWKDC